MCILHISISSIQKSQLLLLPTNEVWGKVIFSQVSVILFTEGHAWHTCPQAHMPPTNPRHACPLACTPPNRYYKMQSMSRQHASYWNAFLLPIINSCYVYITLINNIFNPEIATIITVINSYYVLLIATMCY